MQFIINHIRKYWIFLLVASWSMGFGLYWMWNYFLKLPETFYEFFWMFCFPLSLGYFLGFVGGFLISILYEKTGKGSFSPVANLYYGVAVVIGISLFPLSVFPDLPEWLLLTLGVCMYSGFSIILIRMIWENRTNGLVLGLHIPGLILWTFYLMLQVLNLHYSFSSC